MTTATITKIVLDRKQTAFVEKTGSNGIGVISGTVDEIGEAMERIGCDGCKIIFSTAYAPNFKRCFNAYVKRAKRIAEVAGVSLSPPVEYVIDGFRQADKWAMEIE